MYARKHYRYNCPSFFPPTPDCPNRAFLENGLDDLAVSTQGSIVLTQKVDFGDPDQDLQALCYKTAPQKDPNCSPADRQTVTSIQIIDTNNISPVIYWLRRSEKVNVKDTIALVTINDENNQNLFLPFCLQVYGPGGAEPLCSVTGLHDLQVSRVGGQSRVAYNAAQINKVVLLGQEFLNKVEQAMDSCNKFTPEVINYFNSFKR